MRKGVFMQDISSWKFWNPDSGFGGGVVLGLVVVFVLWWVTYGCS
jgi:hypothetical protein